jgi:hypothetical protein
MIFGTRNAAEYWVDRNSDLLVQLGGTLDLKTLDWRFESGSFIRCIVHGPPVIERVRGLDLNFIDLDGSLNGAEVSCLSRELPWLKRGGK